MPFSLHKTGVKETPFRQGSILRFQMGVLTDVDTNKPTLRYSRSMEVIRARYRIVLQYEGDETYTPYVFDVARPKPNEGLEIRPDSEPAREIWISAKDLRKDQLYSAINAIFEFDIED